MSQTQSKSICRFIGSPLKSRHYWKRFADRYPSAPKNLRSKLKERDLRGRKLRLQVLSAAPESNHVIELVADFRRDNSAGIRNVCRRFVMLCRELKLFSQALVAIDGSKFKAVNSRDCNFTNGKIDRRQEQIEESIQRYLSALETADRTQPVELEAKTVRLKEKIARLGAEMNLNVLAYNFKRVLSILGFEAMMKTMRLVGA